MFEVHIVPYTNNKAYYPQVVEIRKALNKGKGQNAPDALHSSKQQDGTVVLKSESINYLSDFRDEIVSNVFSDECYATELTPKQELS